ncbi:magnesium transporter CorA family protein [Streptococcus ovuberis]|uniref:Magnesium transporter CorA family protein n=1 Tax=Streptococcus ovuberis TaxID=1936207 RepID=A0A7X6MXN7_9STRE|nr:magnesium transporter CorA family protein [Streptococcus ovuberis]NKZ19393.1 magnesium transporter CorA family protein [Streptococcus ovuberis]
MYTKTFSTNTWLAINLDSLSDITSLEDRLAIDEELAAYITDENEMARLEYDKDQGRLVLIYNVIHQEKEDNSYDSSPITFILKPNRVTTLVTNKTAYLLERLNQMMTKYRPETVYDFLFWSLVVISKDYVKILDRLDKELTQTNHLIRQRTTKDRLLALSDIEMSMIYIRSDSKQNLLVLEQLTAHGLIRQLSDEEREKLDDALIEARQILEMAELNTQTMGQLSSTYNNVLNNQLNDTMKILTVLSILLATPDIITGFFGINVPLPDFLVNSKLGWLMVIGIIVLVFLVVYRMVRSILKEK